MRWEKTAVRSAVSAALALVAAAASTPGAARSDAGRVVAGLQAWLDGTRQLEARFEQELLSGALGSGLRESGRMYLERPGQMRWDYRDPEPKTAMIRGQRMELYVAEDAQLIRSTVPEDGDLLPRLLAGEGRLAELFDAETIDGVEGRRGLHLRLVPRDRSETFEEVELTLRPSDFSIQRALVLDAAGNRVEYRFTALKRNRGLPPGIFAFEPPPGTEIVDQP